MAVEWAVTLTAIGMWQEEVFGEQTEVTVMAAVSASAVYFVAMALLHAIRNCAMTASTMFL